MKFVKTPRGDLKEVLYLYVRNRPQLWVVVEENRDFAEYPLYKCKRVKSDIPETKEV